MSNYLIHHGIKGQSWGHQNGPPYPLSRKEHAKVIAKAAAGTVKKAAVASKNAVVKVKNKRDEKIAEKAAAEREMRNRTATARDVLDNLGDYSDEELKAITNRLADVARIQNMATIDQKNSIGAQFVEYMKKDIGKPLATTAVNSAISIGFDRALGNKTSKSDAVKTIIQNTKKIADNKAGNSGKNNDDKSKDKDKEDDD